MLCFFYLWITVSFGSGWKPIKNVPADGISNPLGLDIDDYSESKLEGARHVFEYPVEITGHYIATSVAEKIARVKKYVPAPLARTRMFWSMDQWQEWLGLMPYSKKNLLFPEYLQKIPEVSRSEASGMRMGGTIFDSGTGPAITFSCLACHGSNLFGVPVIGLSGRFPKTFEFFKLGKQVAESIPKILVSRRGRKDIGKFLKRQKERAHFIESKIPPAPGLDTSLALVALSLSRRANDPYASLIQQKNPRYVSIRHKVAASKPAPFWNVKYKNKWLLDGSLSEGNPILTNILWNEIGRGTDLKELEKWIADNQKTIDDLTTFVFSVPSPKYYDFFPEKTINIEKAIAGQKVFNKSCSSCHGSYVKGWEKSKGKTYLQKLNTEKYLPLANTVAIDVGTDPARAAGMKDLTVLNGLAISKKYNITVEVQKGYIPPPLQGIWSRWPYLHNNSVPNLCALFSSPSERPATFTMGMPVNPETDYDHDCLGYPVGSKAPKKWRINSDYTFDTRREGLSNLGHAEGIFLNEGEMIFSKKEISSLIEFLKTL